MYPCKINFSLHRHCRYTAISINVVGKRRQAYATRPKGNIGRNRNSIVGRLAIARFKERKQKQIWCISCEGRAVVYCFCDCYRYSFSVWSRRLDASYRQRLLNWIAVCRKASFTLKYFWNENVYSTFCTQGQINLT